MTIDPITLDESKALLARVGYQIDWTESELIEAVEKLPPHGVALLQEALRCVAASEFAEVHMLERFAEGRRQ